MLTIQVCEGPEKQVLAKRAVEERYLPHRTARIVQDPAPRAAVDVTGVRRGEPRGDGIEGLLDRKTDTGANTLPEDLRIEGIRHGREGTPGTPSVSL